MKVLYLASKICFITDTAILEPDSILQQKVQENTKVTKDLISAILDINERSRGVGKLVFFFMKILVKAF